MNRRPTAVLTFAERTEQVYFLAAEHTRAFMDGVEARLRRHTFRPGLGLTSAHYVTTLYFDSAAQEIARSCEQGDQNIKLRAREYYDREPNHTIRREPFLWLEVKTRDGAKTRKMRVGIPLSDVGTLLQNGVFSRRMVSLRHWLWGESTKGILQEISNLCMRTAEPLRPDCLAHYRRRAWQDPSGALRITLDSELAFYRPPPSLANAGSALSEALIGPPAGRLDQKVIEIKLRGHPPAWLRRLIFSTKLEPAGEGPRPFSKFIAASRAVHLAPQVAPYLAFHRAPPHPLHRNESYED